MTKETLVERLERNFRDAWAELSPEEREEFWPKRPANLDYVPEDGIDLFEEDEKIQQEQIDRWRSHLKEEAC